MSERISRYSRGTAECRAGTRVVLVASPPLPSPILHKEGTLFDSAGLIPRAWHRTCIINLAIL